MKSVDMKKNPGVAKLPTAVRNKMGYMKKGGLMKHDDKKQDMKMDKSQDKKMIKKAVGMHDKQQHGGKKTSLTTLKKGGTTHKMPDGSMMAGKKHGMSHGGMAAKKMARGGGVEIQGKTKGKMITMKRGGAC